MPVSYDYHSNSDNLLLLLQLIKLNGREMLDQISIMNLEIDTILCVAPNSCASNVTLLRTEFDWPISRE